MLLVGKSGSTPTDSDSGPISRIVKELNCLPIALEQAGILLRKRVLTFDNFVIEYKRHYEKLMGPPAKPMDVFHEKERSIGTILSMLYTHVASESHDAAMLLQVIAILRPSRIPVRFLLEIAEIRPKVPDIDTSIANMPIVPGDETLLRLHLSILEDLCLLSIQTSLSSESVLLHRLICQWLPDSSNVHMNDRVIPTAIAVCRVLCQEKRDLDWYVAFLAV